MKKTVNLWLYALTLLCACMVIGGYHYAYSQNKQRALVLEKSLRNEQGAVGAIVAERDACLAKPAPLCPSPALVATAQNPVADVFEPDAGTQSKIDALKKRYEEMLVTWFVLKKCGRATSTEYHILTSALAQEMASLNAPGRLQYDILTSAQGSYQELYSGNKCEANTIDPLQTQYKAFIDGVAEKFTPR